MLLLVPDPFIDCLAIQVQYPSLYRPFWNKSSNVDSFNGASADPLIVRLRDSFSKFIESVLNGTGVGINHYNQPLFGPARIRHLCPTDQMRENLGLIVICHPLRPAALAARHRRIMDRFLV
jgi:hypothetical protein